MNQFFCISLISATTSLQFLMGEYVELAFYFILQSCFEQWPLIIHEILVPKQYSLLVFLSSRPGEKDEQKEVTKREKKRDKERKEKKKDEDDEGWEEVKGGAPIIMVKY